jgi:hypothetical protein
MLMVILALVMLGNVVIWSIPSGSEGDAAQGSATP